MKFTRPAHFLFASQEQETFFNDAARQVCSYYPPTVVALYLLAATPETRERFWSLVDPDGNLTDNRLDTYQDADSRRVVALASNLTLGTEFGPLAPAILFDTPLKDVLCCALSYYLDNLPMTETAI